MRPPEDFELEALTHDIDEPDDTLAMAGSSSSSPAPSSPRPSSPKSALPFPTPKWLNGGSRSSRRARSSRGRQQQQQQQPWHTTAVLTRLFRPRLTVRYILFTILLVLVLFRLLTSPHLLASPLPQYTGPYGVGAIDVEVPLPGGTRLISDTALLRETGDPAFKVETVLATLYYPTSKSFKSKRQRYYWFPKPISITAQGYARLAGADNFITRPIFTFALWAIGGSITIPAEVDAPLLDLEEAENDEGKFPVMVFSHGFASSRTDYTNYLGEIASRGHVIAAIEHRDGSGPGSMVTYVDSDDAPKDRKVLPIKSKDLTEEMDTPQFKATQLAFRDAEIQGAIDLLAAVNSNSSEVIQSNSRSPRSDPYTTLSNWKDRLDFSLLTIGGHSYGATGALQALVTTNNTSPSSETDRKRPKAAAGIILDPGKGSGPLNNHTTQPLLIIHSNSWSRTHSPFHGRPHFDTVRDIAHLSPQPSWFLTSIGTSHPSVTDAPLIEPLLLSWTTGANMDTKEALVEYVRASMEFLDFVAGEKKGELLKEAVTHEQYGEWVSEKRKEEFPKELARLWEIHVSPRDDEE